MGSAAQNKAVQNYRKRLSRRGMARFEVVGLDRDRELIRAVARKIAEDTPEAAAIRDRVQGTLNDELRRTGGILKALQQWPVADLDLKRPFEPGRKIDL